MANINSQKKVKNQKEQKRMEKYTYYNIPTLQKAMKELESDTFVLWVYISSNAPNWEFELSNQAVKNATGLSRYKYDKAIAELIEKNYLVETEVVKNKMKLWNFYENPKTVVEETIKTNSVKADSAKKDSVKAEEPTYYYRGLDDAPTNIIDVPNFKAIADSF